MAIATRSRRSQAHQQGNDESSATAAVSAPSTAQDDEEEDLDALFQRTVNQLKVADAQRTKAAKAQDNFTANEDEIALEGAPEAGPSGSAPRQPIPSPAKEQGKESSAKERQLDQAFRRLRRGEGLGDDRPLSQRQTKKQRQAERDKTAGAGWFDLPAFGGATTSQKKGPTTPSETRAALLNPHGRDGDGRGPSADEMRRQVQAIRLRNAVDPKRFYRGSVKGDNEMPRYAQLGRIVAGSGEAAATMTREQRGKTVMDELVRDAEMAAFAKRKFGEQQAKSMVSWSSHVRKNPRKKSRR